MSFSVIAWTPDGRVRFLDQTRLPESEIYREVSAVDEMIEAIKALRVRGAPLIGISAAMGLAAAAAQAARTETLTPAWLHDAVTRLGDARPTAVNLQWALERMERVARTAFDCGDDPASIVEALRAEANAIHEEDAAMCRAMGEAGAELVPDPATIITHCNTGALATGGIGTALGVITVAHEQGKQLTVYSCEARPLNQGTRLTAWELVRLGIPVHAIVDSAAATTMATRKVDLVIVGADRIAANGDVANKIGTYNLAIAARRHAIPFYVAAPRSTFDLSLGSGREIPIEERAADEVSTAPGAQVYNPAFDVTPAELLTAIVTDKGVVRPPYEQNVKRVFD